MKKTDEEVLANYSEQLSNFIGLERELVEALITSAYVTGYLDSLEYVKTVRRLNP